MVLNAVQLFLSCVPQMFWISDVQRGFSPRRVTEMPIILQFSNLDFIMIFFWLKINSISHIFPFFIAQTTS